MDYCSFVKLKAAERIDGQTILLGERPATENLMRPIFNFRDENICAYDLAFDYKAMCQIKFAL